MPFRKMASTARPTLQQLLRLSFSEPVHWLTGSPPVEVYPTWVSLDIEELRPGDLVLFTPHTATPEALLKATGLGAACALVIGTDEASDRLPQGALPVAFLKGRYELRDAQQVLLTILLSQRAALMERGVRIHTQLSQLASQGEGLESLASAMSDLSSRGVLVQDKRLVVLAGQPSPALAGIWVDILEGLCDPGSLPEALRDRKAAGRQNSHRYPGAPRRSGTPDHDDLGRRGSPRLPLSGRHGRRAGCPRPARDRTGSVGMCGGDGARQGRPRNGKTPEGRLADRTAPGRPVAPRRRFMGHDHGSRPGAGAPRPAFRLGCRRPTFPPASGDPRQRRGDPAWVEDDRQPDGA